MACLLIREGHVGVWNYGWSLFEETTRSHTDWYQQQKNQSEKKRK